ncbi:IS607 family transposase [Kyrpidia tusciae]|uniref:DNA binding domain protein, excisionase family n=1 Tax=Kyrpidia tusciae (strain DSM 2912 / NBRC 15312 / T2) TaxID=562970 RepID=D5WX09_KYRT2|nr:IS607 family transposase [Kyrpidia tusciae]ADG07790.1 DNA binding domain protein, excisionase family [Kyrpidia tusciae DSM 2912]
MKDTQYLPIGKVAKMLGLSVQTIRRWEKAGKIHSIRSPGNHRLFDVEEVRRLLGKPAGDRTAIYARVSSAKQKADGNLQRQRERLERYAEERGYDVVRVFSEQASGINENRKQLAALLKLAEDGEIDRVLIEYPDRMARFGYRYLERFFESHGVAVESTHKTEPKTSQQELVEDLLTIITVFSARMYGKRSQEFRKKIGQAMKEMGGEGTGHGHQDDPDRDSQGGPSVQEGGPGEDQGHL